MMTKRIKELINFLTCSLETCSWPFFVRESTFSKLVCKHFINDAMTLIIREYLFWTRASLFFCLEGFIKGGSSLDVVEN